MYNIILSLLYTAAHAATYQQRYEATGHYPTYSTVANLYDQNPLRTAGFSNDNSAAYSSSRYPNYNPSGSSYTTSSYGNRDLSSYKNQNSNYQGGYQGSYNEGGYNQGGYNQGGYNQGGYNQGGYNQGGYSNNYNTGLYGSGVTGRYGEGYSSYEMPFMGNIGSYCTNRSPQNGIWVDSLMGMWYGVEVVQHLAGDSFVDTSYTCIVIHIAEPVEQVSTVNP